MSDLRVIRRSQEGCLTKFILNAQPKLTGYADTQEVIQPGVAYLSVRSTIVVLPFPLPCVFLGLGLTWPIKQRKGLQTAEQSLGQLPEVSAGCLRKRA